MAQIGVVNLAQKLSLFDEYWAPKIVGELDGMQVKVVKFKGEFVWHRHATEDELFLVLHGQLRVNLRDGELQLGPGELVIIPHGVEHQPVADDEVHVLLLEPATTRNTGEVQGPLTRDSLERL